MRSVKRAIRILHPLLFALLLALSIVSPVRSPAQPSSPLFAESFALSKEYDGVGMPAPLFWTGDGNRINNTSFENGNYQPWIPVQSNALSTAAGIKPVGYDGASSLGLTLSSGNFSNNNFWDPGEPVLYDSNANGVYDSGEPIIKGPTPPSRSLLQHDPFIRFNDANVDNSWTPGESVIFDADLDIRYGPNDIVITGTPPPLGTVLREDLKLTFVDQNSDSYYSVLYDLTREHAGFEASLRLRAAIFLDTLNGTTESDRVEVSLILTTSLGNILTIHYFLSPNPALPSNSTSDAYYRASNSMGLWVLIDRNVSMDAQQAFSSLFSSINSVKEVRLSVFARTQPIPTDDPKIRYVDTNIDNSWEFGETVTYDSNDNFQYDPGELILSGPVPTSGISLKDDPRIKFVDSNSNNVWNPGSPGESIIYDKNSNGQWDPFSFGEVVIYGNNPTQGTLLQKPVHQTTRSLFDRIELYSATGNYDWLRNGAFTNGLASWASRDFTTSQSVFNITAPSASGTITNGAIELGQSVDGRPRIEPAMNLKASVRVERMTGTSQKDSVKILLGIVDSRGYAFSIYYVFRTGDLSLPANNTSATYTRTSGFGLLGQWVSVNRNLSQDTQGFSNLGFVPPFRIEVLLLEATADGPSATTTVFFDDLSIYEPYKYGQATSHFYVTPLANATYVYTARSVPQGTFYLDVPLGQQVLNVTAPGGLRIRNTEYSVQVDSQSGTRRITVPSATMFKYPPQGDWLIFTTSTNSIARLYVEDPVKKTENSTLNIGATANLVSRSIDPFLRPIIGASVNITLWNIATSSIILTRTGPTNSQGWFNVTDVNPEPGTYLLQATSFSSYVGTAEFNLSVRENHDVAVSSLTASPSLVFLGDQVTVTVAVANRGGFEETYNLTVGYGAVNSTVHSVLARLTGLDILAGESKAFNFTLDTAGLQIGDYTINARTFMAVDSVPSNDELTTQITITTQNLPPTASFTVSPSHPIVGETVFFDGTGSFDPDGFITNYLWNFGDGSSEISGPVSYHNYLVPRNYTVTLEVTDERGGSAFASTLVSVRTRAVHDVAVDRIEVNPRSVVSSQFVGIQVALRNRGTSPETVDLTVYYNSNVIELRQGISLQPGFYPQYLTIIWDTLDIPAGNYTISATVSLSVDEFPDDNTFTDGQVRILSPPVLIVTPSIGQLGTKVSVKGNGFPTVPNGPGFSPVLVSFDDTFQGFTIARNGEFEFTFNVPHAQPGPHVVRALDGLTGTRATADFQVLASQLPPKPVSVVVDTGMVYFLGDTVDIYVLTSQDGSPVAPSGLRLILVRPDGNLTLSLQSLGPGLYRTSYSVPRTGPTGTYGLVANVQLSNSTAIGLRAFEVKQSWISSQHTRLISMALGIGGILAVIAVAWRQGYFARRNGFPLSSQYFTRKA